MDGSPLALAAFALGTAGNLFKAVPQFVRTAVRGHVLGLAPGAVWLAFTANFVWLSFGVAISDERFVGLSALGTALTAGTIVRFVRLTDHSANRTLGATSVVACGACAIAAAAGAALALEVAGTALGLVVSLPQLFHLWNVRGVPADVSGVSQLEYVVVIAAQVGWTTYWILQGHPVAALGAGWAGSVRLVTLAMLRQRR